MVKKVNLLPEKCGYLAKNWFIWFKPACTAQSANPSSKTWFKRPDEQYIHGFKAIFTPFTLAGGDYFHNTAFQQVMVKPCVFGG